MSRENCINRIQTSTEPFAALYLATDNPCPVQSLKYSNEAEQRNFNDGFSFTV